MLLAQQEWLDRVLGLLSLSKAQIISPTFQLDEITGSLDLFRD